MRRDSTKQRIKPLYEHKMHANSLKNLEKGNRFPPGVSGNPNGRRNSITDAINRLVELSIEDLPADSDCTVAELIAKTIIIDSIDRKSRSMSASQEKALDRTDGPVIRDVHIRQETVNLTPEIREIAQQILEKHLAMEAIDAETVELPLLDVEKQPDN